MKCSRKNSVQGAKYRRPFVMALVPALVRQSVVVSWTTEISSPLHKRHQQTGSVRKR